VSSVSGGDPGSAGPGDIPPVRMAHSSPKVTQAKRLMAHPVRRGPLGALTGLSGGGGHDVPSQRRRELATVAVLLLIATVITASLPGGWASSVSAPASPSPTAAETLADPVSFGSASASPVDTSSASPSPSPSATASASVSPSAAPTPAPLKFVTLGDSLTAWPTSGPWPQLLDAKDGRLVLAHNAGVPGNTTAQMLARFNRDVANYHPSVLFILGGTNDLGNGVSQATIIANLRSIIVAARAKKMHIFILNVPPENSAPEVPRIDSLNAAIVHLANGYAIVVIDIHSVLSDSKGQYQSKYTSDGLHFNALGSQTVANTVYSRIHRLGY
jgi:lysophospholipase L1-like esterase